MIHLRSTVERTLWEFSWVFNFFFFELAKRILRCNLFLFFFYLILLAFISQHFAIFKFFEAINKTFLSFLFLCFSPIGTIFLFFTLNAFCSFYMLSLKTFTIFQLIERANWILLSAFGIFALCLSSETTNKAITDCTTLLNTMYSHDGDENINHKVKVRWNHVYTRKCAEKSFFCPFQPARWIIFNKAFFFLLASSKQIEIIFTKIIIQSESFVFTCGYFDINMSLLHSFVYTSITYLVILLQFNFE